MASVHSESAVNNPTHVSASYIMKLVLKPPIVKILTKEKRRQGKASDRTRVEYSY
jgi:hypothetical protein